MAEGEELRGRVTERQNAEEKRRKTYAAERIKSRAIGREADTEFRTKHCSEARITESLMKYT